MCCQCPGVRPLHGVREIESTPAAVSTALRARLAPVPVARPQDDMLVYRDMSGESLHHRGYRSAMHRASLNEAAAAGILLLAGWPSAAEANPGGRKRHTPRPQWQLHVRLPAWQGQRMRYEQLSLQILHPHGFGALPDELGVACDSILHPGSCRRHAGGPHVRVGHLPD